MERLRTFGTARIIVALSVAVVLLAWRSAVHAQTGTGTIRGRVVLTAAAPPNPIIRMGADPACSALWTSERPTQEFVVRGAAGELANVFAMVQGPFPQTPLPATPVVLDQKGCLYHPHVVGIRAGQTLEIRNGDPTTHNVHSVSALQNEFNVSRPPQTAPVNVVVAHPELMMRLTCDIHSWMNIFVGVVDHPYFAVSDRDGRFEIVNVPAGNRRLQIWHERYGPQAIDVEVEVGAVRDVTLTYTGAEKPAPLSSIASVVVPAGRPVTFVAGR